MGRKGEQEQEDRAGAREQEREEGTSSPFCTELGTPGCCQVTMGRSLDKMPTKVVPESGFPGMSSRSSAARQG